jgi:chorismate mutase
MSSDAKIAASRANAKNSTGPKTEAGKAVSSRNNTRHGLAGKEVVLRTEDPARYEALLADLMRAYEPANAAESILVEEIAQNFWRLQRARSIEVETLNLEGGGADPVIAYGIAEPRLDHIRRYMTTIERAYHRAMQQLEKTQAIRMRRAPEVEEPEEPTETEQPTQPLPADTQRLFVVPAERLESAPADPAQPPGH